MAGYAFRHARRYGAKLSKIVGDNSRGCEMTAQLLLEIIGIRFSARMKM